METNNNIKDFNIAEALRYAPKGLKLYSPLLGEVRLEKVSDHDDTILVTTKYKSERVFFEDGKYDLNGECLLFPSINHRCWNHWQNTLFLESIGSICIDTITGNKFILGEDGTYFSDNTGNSYHFLIDDEDSGNYLLNSRYASPEEAKEFFEELNKNGYKWDGKMVVKSTSQPKFKIGDIIKHKPTGQINTIKKVCSNFYILDNNQALFFESQDMWELAASKVEVTPQDKVPTSLEVYHAVNNIKSLGNKVSILADEILALKEKLLALEKLAKDSEIRIDALECGGKPFQCSDKAGDNVTLEEMRK